MSVSGHWEGKLVDVTGLTALIGLDLQDAAGNLRGDFSIRLLPEVGHPSDSAGPPQVQTGPVEGRVDEASRQIELRYGMTVGLRPLSVSVDGRLIGAQPHATQAIFGSYEIHEGLDTLTLEGGGVVLWQYGAP